MAEVRPHDSAWLFDECPCDSTASFFLHLHTGEYTSDKLQALKQDTFAFNAKASSTAKQGELRPSLCECVLCVFVCLFGMGWGAVP